MTINWLDEVDAICVVSESAAEGSDSMTGVDCTGQVGTNTIGGGQISLCRTHV